jgi:hypothetical protein
VNFSVVPAEGYNSFRGPGVRDVDLSVARLFKLNERYGLKLRAEAFNLFNHANFQQNAVDNVQYTTSQECTPVGDPNCTPLPVWDATANTDFGHALFCKPPCPPANATIVPPCPATYSVPSDPSVGEATTPPPTLACASNFPSEDIAYTPPSFAA